MENQLSSIIQMNDISKKFGDVQALNHVSIDVNPGEILGLMGENGAGKTTLMNILFGIYQPDHGVIQIDGTSVHIRSPHDAIIAGLGMVHQHFMLVRNFTVRENLALGFYDGRSPLIDLDSIEEKIIDLCEKYSIQVDPRSRIEQLSVGEQQRVEILNLLLREAKILILDEPTAVLTPPEIESLLASIKKLKQQGNSIIFITHKLDEVMAIADRIVVLRRGDLVGIRNKSETTREELATLMVGRQVYSSYKKKKRSTQPELLSVNQIRIKNNRGLIAVKDVSFSIERGEILGIAGVEGNGQNELCEALAGMRKIESGEIRIKNASPPRYNSREAIRMGVCYVPEDRQRTGLVLGFPVWRNFILKRYREKEFNFNSFLRNGRIKEFSMKLVEEYEIRLPNELTKTHTLSGGNQQKLILAREFSSEPEIIIANQPTRGLDIGATEYVHQKLLQQRENGKGILIVSMELSELILLCDRIAVMFGGRILELLPIEEANMTKLGVLMGGHNSR